MRIIRKPVGAIILTFAALFFAATAAEASHFRFGHLTWRPRPDIGPNTAEFTSKVGFRRSAFGNLQVGNVITISEATVTFGDNTSSSAAGYTVLSINPADDWFLAEKGGILHTYPAPNNGGVPWVARFASCCRIYSPQRNAPGTSFEVQATVNLALAGNASPLSTVTPIIPMAKDALNSIVVPVGEPNNDQFSCRLATFSESGILRQPGPPVSGPIHALTVAAVQGGCRLEWDTTGTQTGELWATQLVILDNRPGIPAHGRVGLEFLIQIVQTVGTTPQCDVPPTPTGTIQVIAGTTFQGTIQGSDPDPNETLVLNSSGIPAQATLVPALPLVGGSPISTQLTFSPTLLTLGPKPFFFTITDSNNQQATCPFTLDAVFDPFGGSQTTGKKRNGGTLTKPPGGNSTGARCVETSDQDCANLPTPLRPTCDPDFTGVDFTDFDPNGEFDFDITLSDGNGTKIVCCEIIDAQGLITQPFCDTIELQIVCNDEDGDGFGSPGDPSCPNGDATDCDDANAGVSPNASEVCLNNTDDDCDGQTDEDFNPPGITCPPDAVVECPGNTDPSATGEATATDDCAVASVGFDDVITPTCGLAKVITRRWTAVDTGGNPMSCEQVVQFVDSTRPSLDLTVSPTELWPPNHRLVQVTPTWQSVDTCDPAPAVLLVSATSSEPDDANGNGDGHTTGDIAGADLGTADAALFLRAERAGTGPGRVYEVAYQASDACGNTRSGVALVVVPHDQGQGPDPLQVRLEHDGADGAAYVYWSAVGGVDDYDLIRGVVRNVNLDGNRISLGPVEVIARGTTANAYTEVTDGAQPAVGEAFFYLVQYRDARGPSGFGTESAHYPREPASCEAGCP